MIITGTRIRNITRRLAGILEGEQIVIGLTDLDRFPEHFRRLGFSDNPEDGDTVLPSAMGAVSRYNAEGDYEVHRDQPMETAYRQSEWHWTEWHGPYEVNESRIVDVPYQRYPRAFLPPPSVEVTTTTDVGGNRLLVTPTIAFIPPNYERILHTVNLFLEVFGECNVMDRNLESIYQPRIRRVNWTILPQGRMPWPQLSRELSPIVRRQPEGNQPVIQHRLQAVNFHEPEFVAVGRGGFDGYVIFGFPDRHMFILECVHLGNATYVFGDDWGNPVSDDQGRNP